MIGAVTWLGSGNTQLSLAKNASVLSMRQPQAAVPAAQLIAHLKPHGRPLEGAEFPGLWYGLIPSTAQSIAQAGSFWGGTSDAQRCYTSPQSQASSAQLIAQMAPSIRHSAWSGVPSNFTRTQGFRAHALCAINCAALEGLRGHDRAYGPEDFGPQPARRTCHQRSSGVPAHKIQQQTGHKSLSMLTRYIRDAGLFDGNAAGDVL